jgi:hypothetical protein
MGCNCGGSTYGQAENPTSDEGYTWNGHGETKPEPKKPAPAGK